jgi:replicative DNA helicase
MTLDELALLGHLIGDGCTLPSHAIQYTTNDEGLARTVADLAIRVFGDLIRPRIKRERDWYQVYLRPSFRLTHGVHNPVADWLRRLGAFGFRSYEKFVPEKVFQQPASHIAHFLRHLWATDGSVHLSRGVGVYKNIYYASSSLTLARDVQRLLLRLDITACLSRHSQGTKGRDLYHVRVSGRADTERFLDHIGGLGTLKAKHQNAILEHMKNTYGRSNRELLPQAVWSLVAVPGVGPGPNRRHLTRERAQRLAVKLGSETLDAFATSDVYWDQVLTIESDGVSDVYDLTVERNHNFVTEDVIAHNSLEQDADLVLFIYRERMYNDNLADDKRNIAEILIGKHRNGPVGKVELLFVDEQTKFVNLDRRR